MRVNYRSLVIAKREEIHTMRAVRAPREFIQSLETELTQLSKKAVEQAAIKLLPSSITSR